MTMDTPRLARMGTTLASALLLSASPVFSAEVGVGGALDLTLSGFIATQAHGGAFDNQQLEPDQGTGLDFSTDVELHVVLRGRDARSGLEYGGEIELEADTDSDNNADKTWVFLRGGFGEVRLGDEEGPVEESVVGGDTVAAGTGGIDGEVIDELALSVVEPSNSDTATKIRYYTPSFAGVRLGLSYTPNFEDKGASLAPTEDVEIGDWVEAALVVEREVGDVELEAALVGSLGDVKDSDEFAGGDNVWTYQAGAAAEIDDVSIGAGFGDENVGGQRRRYFNVGAAYDLGATDVSITYGRVLRAEHFESIGKPWSLALSADRGLMKGLSLQADLLYFDNDLEAPLRQELGGDNGWVWVTRLELAF
jgi:predicted porin